MPPKIIAALDIGEARIGLALSNAEGTLALPHDTVWVKQCDPFAEIAAFFTRNHVQIAVIGWPLELDGSEGPAIRRTRQFLAKLKKCCPQMRFVPQDERLTSVAAENALVELQTKGSHKKDVVDSMAACFILQMYLDRKKARKNES